MITEVTLENFKSHRHTHLKFDKSRLHAIVGQNSVGKTSVLQAIYSLGKLDSPNFNDIKHDPQRPKYLVRKNSKSILIKLEGKYFKDDDLAWELDCSYDYIEGALLPTYFLSIGRHFGGEFFGESDFNFLSFNDISRKEEDYKDIVPIIDHFKDSVYLKMLPGNLAKAAYSDELSPKIDIHGYGLGPTLDFMLSESPGQSKILTDKIKRVVPDVKRISVGRAKTFIDRKHSVMIDKREFDYSESQEVVGQEVVLDMQSGDRIPGHALSEGTLLTLGLLTVLMSPNRPNLILLDDIQQGLHPKAQRELMTVIQGIIKENPELQIIFTTHSPYIIDELKPSQVHVLHSDAEGFTLSKRLDEHPDVDWAMQTLTTGEFWGAEGEEWVATASDENLETDKNLETKTPEQEAVIETTS